MLRLQFCDKPDEFVKLSASISLGSDEGNDLVIHSSTVSDFHAEILVDDNRLVISDLLSASGTYINGRRINQPSALSSWDIIRLGAIELEVLDPNSCRPGDWGLRAKSNLLANKIYPLTADTVIGRDSLCSLQIESNLLSRQHARLSIDIDKLHVEDLNSTNGTFLNGERITQSDAYPDDELRFDQLTFTVVGPVSRDETDPQASAEQTEMRGSPDQLTELSQITRHTNNEAVISDDTDYLPAAMPSAFIVESSGLMQPPRQNLVKMQYRIGRNEDCDIVLADSSVSKYHARLQFVDQRWVVEDLQSSNGIKLNSETLEARTELRTGDVIRLGRIEVEFTSEHEPVIRERVSKTALPDQAKKSVAAAITAKPTIWKLGIWVCLAIISLGGGLLYCFKTGVF